VEAGGSSVRESDGSRPEVMGQALDAPPPQDEPCRPGARGCSPEHDSTRVCGEQGRWTFEATCPGGTSCSAGACLCPAGLCEDGVVLQASGLVDSMAAGGDLLHFQRSYSDVDLIGIHRIDLRTNAVTPVVPDGPGHSSHVPLAADPMGTLYWCRSFVSGRSNPALMRGNQRLETIDCTVLQASATHLYLMTASSQQLHRRAFDRPGLQVVWSEPLVAFAVAGQHAYLASYQDERTSEAVLIRRVLLADPRRVETVAAEPEPREGGFNDMAADTAHVYFRDRDRLRRAPVSGGAVETFWQGPGLEVKAMVLSDTHVYWSTETPGVNSCTETTAWRQPKGREEDPIEMARYPASCSRADLLLLGDYLYLATSSVQAGSQIVRLRR
jgi:hypothetical protein